MPGPSFRPFLGAVGTGMLMLGLVFGGWLLAAGVIALIATLVGWLIDARKEYVKTDEADTTGHLENMPAPRTPALLLVVLAVLLIGGVALQAGWLPPRDVSGGEGAAASGAPPAARRTRGSGEPGARPVARANPAAPVGRHRALPRRTSCVHAKNIAFAESSLTAPADRPFTLAFVNEDAGTPHNVELKDGAGASVYQGEIFTGRRDPGVRRARARRGDVHVPVHGPSEHDGQRHPPVGRTQPRGHRHAAPSDPHRPGHRGRHDGRGLVVRARRRGPSVGVGQPAPRIVGTTLDGEAFDLATYAGRPVVLNFWGPTCIPCRDEFPLLAAKLAEHADDGLAIVGVLTDDPAPLARDFVAEFGATWPTVEDPDKADKTAYRVLGRPQTFFIDGVRGRALRPDRRGSRQRLRDALRADRAVTAAAVVVEDLRKRYDDRAVVDGVSLDRRAGRARRVARTQRRRQDDDGRDRRGLSDAPTPGRCGSSGRTRRAAVARCEPAWA